MTDKIPSFKEEIDAIHVPIDKLDAIILNTVQGNVAMKKRSFRKKLMYSAASAVAAFGLLIGSAVVSPVMANIVSQIPIIGSIFNESGDRGLKQVSDMGLTQVVGQSQVIGDMTLTIDEVYYDGTRFTIGYSFESETPIGETQLPSPRLSIKGEPIGSAMTVELNDVTRTLQTQLLNINAPDLPTEFDLDLTFQADDGKQWDFSIPVRTQTDTERVAVDHTQEVGGFTLSVSDLKISPAGVLLSYGKTYQETEENTFLSQHIAFEVVDELGNEVVSRTGNGQGQIVDGKMVQTGSQLYEPIDDDVNELTITPFMTIPRGMTEMDEDGNEIEIEIDIKQYQGKGIKFDSFTVKLQ